MFGNIAMGPPSPGTHPEGLTMAQQNGWDYADQNSIKGSV